MKDHIQVIAFDADDTLWVNEPYFQETEKVFAQMLEDFLPAHTVNRELLSTEMANLSIYGYGIKSFTLSMVETALRISEGTIAPAAIQRILDLGKTMLTRPVELLDGVEDVLQALEGKYRLVMATKGDLLDQQRKLRDSGLERYFHHIEIVSEKDELQYRKLISHLDIAPNRFLMIGNSIKSDVLPILALGGHAFHVPYHTTWAHEQVDKHVEHPRFRQLGTIAEAVPLLVKA